MESGTIKIHTDFVADKLDELSYLCEYWKCRRERGITPGSIRAALLMIVTEVYLLQPQEVFSGVNDFEKACREWLRGCSYREHDNPEACQECTEAFLSQIKRLGKHL